MFESIRVRNFRSVEDSKLLELADLNIIVGPNNSGKSSCLIYPLLMMKQTLLDSDESKRLVTDGPEVQLGSYPSLLHSGNLKAVLGLEFAMRGPHDQLRLDVAGPGGVSFAVMPARFARFLGEFGWDSTSKQVVTLRSEWTDDLSNLAFGYRSRNGGWEIGGLDAEVKPHLEPRFRHCFVLPVPRPDLPGDARVLAKVVATSEACKIAISKVTGKISSVRHVLPIRRPIDRYALNGIVPSSELGPRGPDLMRILVQDSAASSPLLGKLEYWLCAHFKLMHDLRLVFLDKEQTAASLIARTRTGEGPRVNLADMGTGVSQLVPVIVQAVLLPPKGCLLVEQPEIHLHPRAQADLADLFIDSLNEGRQLIVETHSEHLVLRVRRRIAEGKLDPSRVRIFFVQLRAGKTRVRQLKLDSSGHFPRWPKGFFDEGYEEAMAIAEADLR